MARIYRIQGYYERKSYRNGIRIVKYRIGSLRIKHIFKYAILKAFYMRS